MAVDHGKLTLADLINAMGNAGTQDQRGIEVLPYVLKLIGHPSDPALANAVRLLSAWVASGAHRINRESPGASGNYDQSDAVRLMDAWWRLPDQRRAGPRGVRIPPGLVVRRRLLRDRPEGPPGGAGQEGPGPLNRVYCGKGKRSACRTALEASLRQAIAESPQQVYPADSACAAGDQMCSDSIQFKTIGAISQPLIEWINRPTFQQADEIHGHGPR